MADEGWFADEAFREASYPAMFPESGFRAAEAAGVEVEWVQADMRKFTRPGAYRLALNLFTSFGYFRTDAEDRRVLESEHASLAFGGVFLLDVAGKEVLARVIQPTGSSEAPGGVVVQRRRVVNDWCRYRSAWSAEDCFSFGL